jgi:L-iditol 2-dehydrogenase
MRAVVFHAPKDIRLEERPIGAPKAGEVLVKIGAALTCGTDFKAYRQGHPVLLGKLPSPFGHELSGVVVEAGAGVKGVKAGDRVVAANSAPCDGCYFCRRGQNQLCDGLKLHNGAYAEYDVLPAGIVKHNTHVLPKGLEFAHAALSEPLACAIHAAAELDVRKDQSVAILGAGMMSLLLVQAFKARGARVIVIGRGRPNLEKAEAAGADETLSALDGDPRSALLKLTDGRGADCVVEAVGKAETWEQSLGLVRKGGKVCLFGGCAKGTTVPVDAHRVHYGQISLHGVFHYNPPHFKEALELLAAKKIRTDLLISGRIGLSEVPSYFERMHGQSNAKVAVIP